MLSSLRSLCRPSSLLVSSFSLPRSSVFSLSRAFSASSRPPTGVVMLNMGGPATIPEVGPFLQRLFSDGEIIEFGKFQSILGPWIAKRRTPRIEKQYEAIGGSPIRKWTEIQGENMVKLLDQLSPETAPHKYYVAFRYADPLTEESIVQMKKDGVQRAIAFSQYPQYSCTTTGSSLNHLWRELTRLGMKDQFQWSVIDRWFAHPRFIQAVAKRITMGMGNFPESERDKVILVFSAHSLPMRVVNRSDPYPQEVAATVHDVMKQLNEKSGLKNPYFLSWQSQVGPLPWLGPQTGELIKGLGGQGHQNILVIPIAFTSDHIETLFELDLEYGHVAKEAGVKNYHRSPSLNDEPLIFQAQAEIVAEHLKSGEVCTAKYPMNCAHCVRPLCRSILNPVKPYTKLRDQAKPESPLAKHIANEK